jgi:hypothetical protein
LPPVALSTTEQTRPAGTAKIVNATASWAGPGPRDWRFLATSRAGRVGRAATSKGPRVVTTSRDIVGLLLLLLLLPVWMAVGFGFVALVVTRHLYWWARGNTTATSRASGGSTPALPLAPRPTATAV